MPQVTKIPASIKLNNKDSDGSSVRKRRVAAYARVSTDKDEQLTSYENQIDYYEKYIKERPDWEFVKVYTDEGITGTSTKKREGFKSMVDDALAGKIDLIVTKSVSRFARNTVDSISTIRTLKENKVEVFFEKENIWTFDGKGELMLTIMSSLAQEESRSISENCTWARRKAFAEGKFSLAYSNFLGYDKGPDGNLVINEEQAKVVRKIYDLYLKGYLPSQIAKALTNEGIPTVRGNKEWHPQAIFRILTNEKYRGDALLQKTYTQDFLSKKPIKNNGEVPQYYVEGNHEPIIEPDVFDHVQNLMKVRSKSGCVAASCFANTVICGECGRVYIPKIWHATDKYKKKVWLCLNRERGTRTCKNVHIDESRLKEIFVTELNKLIENKDQVILESKRRLKIKPQLEELDEQLQILGDELNKRSTELEKYLNKSGKGSNKDSEEYLKLCEEYENLQIQYNQVKNERTEISMEGYEGRSFRRYLKKAKPLKQFKEDLWRSYVKSCVVYHDGHIELTFKDCTTVSTMK